MRAIILAAGRGLRLQQSDAEHTPKCLLRFDGKSLLHRHLCLLRNAGVDEVVIAVGFRPDLIRAELDRLSWLPVPEIVFNPQFDLGSVLTVHTVADALTRGGDVLLMDADVLYDERIMHALVKGHSRVNRLLMDHDFEPGEEPVKICVRGGIPVELRKRLAPDLSYDSIGESVGFFRFDHAGATRLAHIVAGYVADGRGNMPHEEAIRDLVLERSQVLEVTDVTGSPWIEIDFPVDVVRASNEVLPQLQPIAGVIS